MMRVQGRYRVHTSSSTEVRDGLASTAGGARGKLHLCAECPEGPITSTLISSLDTELS